ncbi:MAG: PPOX class F420-dependent oxidoreductase [Actinomycetota bacterium]|nr:PPOX class F420-dependent oxidoreductase [Actinomycetota bacterium]
MAEIGEKQAQLLTSKNLGHFATLHGDGSPHLTVVWVDWDGENVLVNTAVGRAKERHLRRDPRAGIEVLDPQDPYNYVSVSGPVELVEGPEAEDHIDKLAQRYVGVDKYPSRSPGERRVIVKLRPERVYYPGSG